MRSGVPATVCRRFEKPDEVVGLLSKKALPYSAMRFASLPCTLMNALQESLSPSDWLEWCLPTVRMILYGLPRVLMDEFLPL